MTKHGRERPVLEVTGLSVTYGSGRSRTTAVDGVDFHVNAGEVLALVGESGSGKSTTALALLDLLPPGTRTAGIVMFHSDTVGAVDILQATPAVLRTVRGSGAAMVFQEPMAALNPVFTIGFQIVETLLVHFPLSPADAATRAHELLRQVELADPERIFRSYPHQLSGGQRQRAMIAQALAGEPKLIIADEPVSSLDARVQGEILELFRRLRTTVDAAFLLITHDLGAVADLADRVAVMRHGRIVETGSTTQILHHPAHAYTQQLAAAGQRLALVSRPAAPDKSGDAAVAGQDPPRPVLEITGAAVDYARHGRVPALRAVDAFTLSIGEGEVVGLVGESGAGKSTLARAAAGLQPLAAGTVKLMGHDVAATRGKALRTLRRHVGMVFQDPASSLNPRLSVGESVGEPLHLAKAGSRAEQARRVDQLFEQVGLSRALRHRHPHELSGGQKQRVGIARAIALNPRLLIADEPTSALDVSVRADVLELLAELQRDHGFAALLISHDMAVVDALAGRVVRLHDGRSTVTGD